jgi:hypothetical protein
MACQGQALRCELNCYNYSLEQGEYERLTDGQFKTTYLTAEIM